MANFNLLRRHVFNKHFSVSVFGPLQLFPPYAGAGALHFLERVLVPLSHLLEQDAQGPHCPQNPSTTLSERKQRQDRTQVFKKADVNGY